MRTAINECNRYELGEKIFLAGRARFRETNDQNSTHHKATMVNRPPPTFIHERLPFRAAAAPRRNPPHQRTQLTCLVAIWQSWAARGLSSSGFAVVAQCFCTVEVGYWKYPFNQPDECFRGSIEPHMHRISSEIVGIERRSGRTAKCGTNVQVNLGVWHG